jgi:hypothetical protein
MVEGRNIFYGVTADNENTTSKLLCNLLRTKYIRDMFLDFLEIPKEIHETITIENISTQTTVPGVGIPDLTIKTGDALYFIENKIHDSTGLQPSQTTKYIEYLESMNKPYKGCVFLLPRVYDDKETKEIENIKEKHSFISIKRWNDLLDYFRKNEIENGSPVVTEVLDYLSNLILGYSDNTTELTVQEVVIMYNPEDLYNALSFAEKVRNLIEKASKSILDELGDGFSPGRSYASLNGYGWYILYNNKHAIWIGLSPRMYGIQNGDFVFSVAFLEKSLKNLNINNIDDNKYPRFSDEEEKCIYIKLDRKILTDEKPEEKLKIAVVDIIKNVFLKNV